MLSVRLRICNVQLPRFKAQLRTCKVRLRRFKAPLRTCQVQLRVSKVPLRACQVQLEGRWSTTPPLAMPSCEDSKPSCEGAKPSCEGAKPSCEDSKPSCEDSKPSCEGAKPSCEGATRRLPHRVRPFHGWALLTFTLGRGCDEREDGDGRGIGNRVRGLRGLRPG